MESSKSFKKILLIFALETPNRLPISLFGQKHIQLLSNFLSNAVMHHNERLISKTVSTIHPPPGDKSIMCYQYFCIIQRNFTLL